MQNPWVQNKVDQQIIHATVFISWHLISFAWDLLTFNVKNICISTIYDVR